MPYINLTRESNSTQDICIKAYEIKNHPLYSIRLTKSDVVLLSTLRRPLAPVMCSGDLSQWFHPPELESLSPQVPFLGSSPLPVSWCAFMATVKGFDNDLISLEAVHKYWLDCRIASKNFIEFLINQLRSSYGDTLGVDGRGCWFTTGRSLRCGAIICWLFWWKRQNGIIEKNDFVINSKGCRG